MFLLLFHSSFTLEFSDNLSYKSSSTQLKLRNPLIRRKSMTRISYADIDNGTMPLTPDVRHSSVIYSAHVLVSEKNGSYTISVTRPRLGVEKNEGVACPKKTTQTTISSSSPLYPNPYNDRMYRHWGVRSCIPAFCL